LVLPRHSLVEGKIGDRTPWTLFALAGEDVTAALFATIAPRAGATKTASEQAGLKASEDASFYADTKGGTRMLAIIGIIVVLAWLLGLTAFHVAGGLVHIALVVGLILIVAHFVMGRSRSTAV
jgi:hypothetical protein